LIAGGGFVRDESLMISHWRQLKTPREDAAFDAACRRFLLVGSLVFGPTGKTASQFALDLVCPREESPQRDRLQLASIMGRPGPRKTKSHSSAIQPAKKKEPPKLRKIWAVTIKIFM
jgi:hypothetical protein